MRRHRTPRASYVWKISYPVFRLFREQLNPGDGEKEPCLRFSALCNSAACVFLYDDPSSSLDVTPRPRINDTPGFEFSREGQRVSAEEARAWLCEEEKGFAVHANHFTWNAPTVAMHLDFEEGVFSFIERRHANGVPGRWLQAMTRAGLQVLKSELAELGAEADILVLNDL